jgi:hypothetical protein
MFTTLNAHKQRVFVARRKDGTPRFFGKVRRVVFHPSRPVAVGVIVKRPDVLWMFKRKERFAALDRLVACEGGFLVENDRADTWDAAACKRLGVDFDDCLLWDYMDCVNEDGEKLGTITAVAFFEDDFAVDHIDISSGRAERALTGARNIPAAHIKGYRDGAIVVDVAAGEVQAQGGLAGKAGQTWATAKHKAGKARRETDEKATKFADEAGDKAEAAGEKLGWQVGAWGQMFKDFKSEYDKASKG